MKEKWEDEDYIENQRVKQRQSWEARGGLTGQLLSYPTRGQAVTYLNAFIFRIREENPQRAGAIYNKYMSIINDHTFPDEVQQPQQPEQPPVLSSTNWYKQAQSYNTVEEAIDWLTRSGIPIEGDKYVFYHGSPKNNNLSELRAGSLLAETEEEALHFASNSRGLNLKDIIIYKVLVGPEDINTGVFASLNKSYKL